jgi:hypothetical protein
MGGVSAEGSRMNIQEHIKLCERKMEISEQGLILFKLKYKMEQKDYDLMLSLAVSLDLWKESIRFWTRRIPVQETEP